MKRHRQTASGQERGKGAPPNGVLLRELARRGFSAAGVARIDRPSASPGQPQQRAMISAASTITTTLVTRDRARLRVQRRLPAAVAKGEVMRPQIRHRQRLIRIDHPASRDQRGQPGRGMGSGRKRRVSSTRYERKSTPERPPRFPRINSSQPGSPATRRCSKPIALRAAMAPTTPRRRARKGQVQHADRPCVSRSAIQRYRLPQHQAVDDCWTRVSIDPSSGEVTVSCSGPPPPASRSG